jgi:hypothetical protein
MKQMEDCCLQRLPDRRYQGKEDVSKKQREVLFFIFHANDLKSVGELEVSGHGNSFFVNKESNCIHI